MRVSEKLPRHCQYSRDPIHITEEGLGPGVVAAVGELLQEEEGELSLAAVFSDWGGCRFLVDIWDFRQSANPEGAPKCILATQHWVNLWKRTVLRRPLDGTY